MPKGYRHLTHPGRCRIHATGKSGISDAAIARRPSRDRTTVWRGARRNPGERGYRHGQAQRRAEARRGAAPSVPRRMTPELWRMVEERLVRGWSPERVSGRLRLEGHQVAGRQWIQRHVRADRRAGGRLWRHLRRRGKRPNRKGGAHAGRGHIPGRADIPGARRWWRGGRGSVTGRPTRSWARAPAGPWCRWWTGRRSTRSRRGSTGRPRTRSARP